LPKGKEIWVDDTKEKDARLIEVQIYFFLLSIYLTNYLKDYVLDLLLVQMEFISHTELLHMALVSKQGNENKLAQHITTRTKCALTNTYTRTTNTR